MQDAAIGAAISILDQAVDQRLTYVSPRPDSQAWGCWMEAWNEPSVVTAVDGYVVMDGPGSVAVAMTPDAAQETGERLIRAAMEAGAKPNWIRLRPMFGD